MQTRSQVGSRFVLDVGGGLSFSGCSLMHTQDTQHCIIYMEGYIISEPY